MQIHLEHLHEKVYNLGINYTGGFKDEQSICQGFYGGTEGNGSDLWSIQTDTECDDSEGNCMKSQYLRNQRKAFRQECIERYGTVCINCGSSERIEWHHVVPLEIGGNDEPSNCVPLCYSCHKAVTNHQLVIVSRLNEWKHSALTGRKVLKEDGWEEILLDYVECRISPSEAAKRLGGRKSFRSMKMFSEFKKRHGIVRHKNNLDIILKWNKEVPDGYCVGTAEYIDGTKKEFYWHSEDTEPQEKLHEMDEPRLSADYRLLDEIQPMRMQSEHYQIVYEDGNPYITRRSS